MKILRSALLAASMATVSLAPFKANAVIDNPVTRAVIEVYDKVLKANPTDYMTWFRRANEYYRHNEYVRALDDVNNALAYAPARRECENELLLLWEIQ